MDMLWVETSTELKINISQSSALGGSLLPQVGGGIGPELHRAAARARAHQPRTNKAGTLRPMTFCIVDNDPMVTRTWKTQQQLQVRRWQLH